MKTYLNAICALALITLLSGCASSKNNELGNKQWQELFDSNEWKSINKMENINE